MDKRIGVGLNSFYAVVLSAISATMLALAVHPSMLTSYIAQIALYVTESRTDTVFSIGLLGAVERAAAHLSGKVGASDTENLLRHDVVDALLQVGNLLFKTCQEPCRNLAQEDAALAARIEEARFAGAKQLGRQQVKHSVGQLGRGEDLIAGKVGQTIENIRTIAVLHICKVGCNAMGDKCARVHRSSAPRLARRRDCTGGFV